MTARSPLAAIAAGMLVAVLALGVVLVVRAGPPTAAERSDALAAELRCPDCQGLAVADSPTRSAQEIRRQIDSLVAAGASDAEIRDHFVARYGEWILLAPSAPAVWLIPVLVVGMGLLALAAWLRRPGSAESGTARRQLSDEERRRIHEEAEALDA